MKKEMRKVNNGTLITKVSDPVIRSYFLASTPDWRYHKPDLWAMVCLCCGVVGIKPPTDKVIVVVDWTTRTAYMGGLGIWAPSNSPIYPFQKSCILESCLSHHAATGNIGDPWVGHIFRFIAEIPTTSIASYKFKKHEKYITNGANVGKKAAKNTYTSNTVSVNDATVSDTTSSGNIYINVVGTATVNINK